MERKDHHQEKHGNGPSHQHLHAGAYNKHAGPPHEKQHAYDAGQHHHHAHGQHAGQHHGQHAGPHYGSYEGQTPNERQHYAHAEDADGNTSTPLPHQPKA